MSKQPVDIKCNVPADVTMAVGLDFVSIDNPPSRPPESELKSKGDCRIGLRFTMKQNPPDNKSFDEKVEVRALCDADKTKAIPFIPETGYDLQNLKLNLKDQVVFSSPDITYLTNFKNEVGGLIIRGILTTIKPESEEQYDAQINVQWTFTPRPKS